MPLGPKNSTAESRGSSPELHCAPTDGSRDALLREGVSSESNVRVTGNTVIDALLHTVTKERANDAAWREKYPDGVPRQPGSDHRTST